MKLVLASASPRRHQLLDQLGVDYQVDPANIDERCKTGEEPEHYVRRMAREKSLTVSPRHPGAAVLGADTTVVIDGDVLGKPRDKADGMAMLQRLSGHKHQVLTALCLAQQGETDEVLVATDVVFSTLTQASCAAYLATPEPWDKAGAYAIQGLAGAFVESIQGSYSNVIGLPLSETWRMLAKCGVRTLLDRGDE